MNNLNSILLEGTVQDNPTDLEGEACFRLVSTRFFHAKNDAGEMVKKSRYTVMDVLVYGKEAEKVKQLKMDQMVRVVGRVEQDYIAGLDYGKGPLHIVAEHIEVKR